MAVDVDVVRGDKTLSQVASEHGAGPSLASEWRDEPPGGADDAPWSADDERLAALIDREHVEHPAYGARKIAHVLRGSGEPRATRWRVTRPVGLMGVRPCRPLLLLSAPSKASRRLYLSMKKSTLCYVDNRHFDSDHADRFTRGRGRHVTTAPAC